MWVGYPNAQVEMRTQYHGGPVAGATFPAEIWHDYMSRVKGKFCGDFKPPKEPFHATPFFGKYSRSGGKGTGTDDQQSGGSQFYSPTTPATPAPTTPDTPDTAEEAGQRQRQRQRQRTRASSTRISTSRPRRALPRPPATTRGGNGQDGGTAAPNG